MILAKLMAQFANEKTGLNGTARGNFATSEFVGRSSLVKGGSAPTSNVIRILVLIPVQIESQPAVRIARRDSRYREMQFRMARTYKA